MLGDVCKGKLFGRSNFHLRRQSWQNKSGLRSKAMIQEGRDLGGGRGKTYGWGNYIPEKIVYLEPIELLFPLPLSNILRCPCKRKTLLFISVQVR